MKKLKKVQYVYMKHLANKVLSNDVYMCTFTHVQNVHVYVHVHTVYSITCMYFTVHVVQCTCTCTLNHLPFEYK